MPGPVHRPAPRVALLMETIHTFSAETSRLVAATDLPAGELRSTHFVGGRPCEGCDNEDIGRMVAEHFYERGFRHFATHSRRNEQFFVERVANFIARTKLTPCPCLISVAGRRRPRAPPK